MASGNVSRLAAVIELNTPSSKKLGITDISIQSRSTLSKKIRSTGVFNNTVMTVADRVQRQRAGATTKSLKSASRGNTDLTFLERKRMPNRGSAGTVATSLTLTSSGSVTSFVGDTYEKAESTEKDPSNSDNHNSFASFESLSCSEFDGGDFDSPGGFTEGKDTDVKASFKTPVRFGLQKAHRQDGLHPSIPIDNTDCAKSREEGGNRTAGEKIKRAKKTDELKGSPSIVSSDRKKQEEISDRRRSCGVRSVEASEGSVVGSKPASSDKKSPDLVPRVVQRREDDYSERSSRRKALPSGNQDGSDTKNPPTISKRRLQSTSNVQKLASMIDSTHSRCLEKTNENISIRGSRSSNDALRSLGSSDKSGRKQQRITETMSDKGDFGNKANEKNRERKLPETTRLNSKPWCKTTGAEDKSICEDQLGLRKGPRNEPSTRKERSTQIGDSSVSSSSDSKRRVRSADERITRSATINDDRTRAGGSSKRRERSVSRERSNVKSRDQSESAQPTSLLESLSDVRFMLGDDDYDDDDELRFASPTSQSTRLKCPPNLLDSADRKTSRGPQEVAQSRGLLKKKDEHGKHTPYRSKFRHQYGATGVVETECLASVKAAKSIFERNRDENDLMRISKMRSKVKNDRQRPIALPLHQSRKHNSDDDDDLSVSLASLVGNIVLPESSHGSSHQSFDLVSLSSACSAKPKEKATPTSDQSPLQKEEKNLKTKTNKSQEFLEKLSLKKAKQDGRKFRGRMRRTKRTGNVDEESCCETEDDTVMNSDDQ